MASLLPSQRRRRVRQPAPRLWHKGAYAVVVLLLLAILALLASAIPSVVSDIRHGIPTYSLTPRGAKLGPTHSPLHIALIGLDEWQGEVTLRISGSHVCQAPCNHSDRIVFVATQLSQQGIVGLPASAAITLPPKAVELTQTFTLPVDGAAIRYPFDTYHLRLGIILELVQADGTIQVLSPAEARGHLALTLQSHLPGTEMDSPTLLDPLSVPIPDSTDHYAVVADLTFARPLYTRILAVLLVLLVGAAAAYAVFLRPLSDLVINAGALVLGVWGVRAILAGTTRPGSTALDLALSVVILFLLAAVTVRMLLYLDHRSGFRLIRRAARPAAAHTAPSAEDANAPRTAEPDSGRPRAPARANAGNRSRRRTHRQTTPPEQRAR